jgi:hypothetical protein
LIYSSDPLGGATILSSFRGGVAVVSCCTLLNLFHFAKYFA